METENEKEKKCFIIMPISDQDGYEKGHFYRVYHHLIKPACIQAGFTPIRADEENKTNYIVIDILKKILDSEMVICDLSAKNANVFYELGIRQAFNRKSVLIKDIKTNRPFDIQGLRSIEYDESLRIDSVEKNINDIAKSLKETSESENDNVNSLIQLLSIKPAKLIEEINMSGESSVILSAIKDIQSRISVIESNKNKTLDLTKRYKERTIHNVLYEVGLYLNKNKSEIGKIIEITDRGIKTEKNGDITFFDNSYLEDNENLILTPF